MKALRTNTTKVNNIINSYILNAIDSEVYDVECNTDKEKLQFLYDCFEKEYLTHQLRYYKGNKQETLKNWIMGLPSVWNIDFMNYRIIEIAKEWGTLRQDATKKEERRVIENWFNLIALKTIRLWIKNGIEI